MYAVRHFNGAGPPHPAHPPVGRKSSFIAHAAGFRLLKAYLGNGGIVMLHGEEVYQGGTATAKQYNANRKQTARYGVAFSATLTRDAQNGTSPDAIADQKGVYLRRDHVVRKSFPTSLLARELGMPPVMPSRPPNDSSATGEGRHMDSRKRVWLYSASVFQTTPKVAIDVATGVSGGAFFLSGDQLAVPFFDGVAVEHVAMEYKLYRVADPNFARCACRLGGNWNGIDLDRADMLLYRAHFCRLFGIALIRMLLGVSRQSLNLCGETSARTAEPFHPTHQAGGE